MCLYPRLIINKKYVPNKKNGGQAPSVIDERTRYVPIGCQNCIECRKQKAREWQARLTEDIKTNVNGYFVTLTFNEESINEISKEITNTTGYNIDNAVATRAIRLFLERWRKKHKVSVRHWLITELGHKGTERIHLHGIIWDKIKWDKDMMEMKLKHYWKYGYIWVGEYVNTRTVNYIIKYVTKVDESHKYYKSLILTSPGIGNNYTTTSNSKKNKYNGEKTKETYLTTTGNEISLPIYWRNKIYSDNEKEQLWITKIDKEERYVLGKKVNTKNGYEKFNQMLRSAQKKNKRLGYGSDEKNWKQEQYEIELRNMKYAERKKKIKNASGGDFVQRFL